VVVCNFIALHILPKLRQLQLNVTRWRHIAVCSRKKLYRDKQTKGD